MCILAHSKTAAGGNRGLTSKKMLAFSLPARGRAPQYTHISVREFLDSLNAPHLAKRTAAGLSQFKAAAGATKAEKHAIKRSIKKGFALVNACGLKSAPKPDEDVQLDGFIMLDCDKGTPAELRRMFAAATRMPETVAAAPSFDFEGVGKFWALFRFDALTEKKPYAEHLQLYAAAAERVAVDLAAAAVAAPKPAPTHPAPPRPALTPGDGVRVEYIPHDFEAAAARTDALASAILATARPTQDRFLVAPRGRGYANAAAISLPIPAYLAPAAAPLTHAKKQGGVFYVEKYLSEAAADVVAAVDASKNVLLQAPTGSGKNRFWAKVLAPHMKKNGIKCALLCPTTAIAKQVASEYVLPLIIQGANANDEGEAYAAGLAVATYDSAHKLGRAFTHFTIDEAHDAAASGSYRRAAIESMLETIEKNEASVLVMSATVPDALKFAKIGGGKFDFLQVDLNDKAPVNTEVMRFEGNAVAAFLDFFETKKAAADLHIIHINSKAKGEALLDALTASKVAPFAPSEVAFLRRFDGLDDCQVYNQLIHKRTVKEGVKVLITTSLIEAGVSIKEGEKAINMYFLDVAPALPSARNIVQFAARPRTYKALKLYALLRERKSEKAAAAPRSEAAIMEAAATKATAKNGAFFADGGTLALASFFGYCNRFNVALGTAIDYLETAPDFDELEAKRVGMYIYKRYENGGQNAPETPQKFAQKSAAELMTTYQKIPDILNQAAAAFGNENSESGLNSPFSDTLNVSIRTEKGGYICNIFEAVRLTETHTESGKKIADLLADLAAFKYLKISEIGAAGNVENDSIKEALKDISDRKKATKEAAVNTLCGEAKNEALQYVYNKTKSKAARTQIAEAYGLCKDRNFEPSAEISEFEGAAFDILETAAALLCRLQNIGIGDAEAAQLLQYTELKESRTSALMHSLKIGLLLEGVGNSIAEKAQAAKFKELQNDLQGRKMRLKDFAKALQMPPQKAREFAGHLVAVEYDKAQKIYNCGAAFSFANICENINAAAGAELLNAAAIVEHYETAAARAAAVRAAAAPPSPTDSTDENEAIIKAAFETTNAPF